MSSHKVQFLLAELALCKTERQESLRSRDLREHLPVVSTCMLSNDNRALLFVLRNAPMQAQDNAKGLQYKHVEQV